MNVLTTQNDIVCQALKALGIPTENLEEVHIHIKPEDIIRADCVYFMKTPALFSIKKLKRIKKQYHLHFEEFKDGKNKTK